MGSPDAYHLTAVLGCCKTVARLVTLSEGGGGFLDGVSRVIVWLCRARHNPSYAESRIMPSDPNVSRISREGGDMSSA